MRFEILDNGSVEVWGEATDGPAMVQDSWPDGTAWGEGEAQAWAEQLLLSWADLTADLPGESPDSPTTPRPAPEPIICHATGLPYEDD
jgi:hypothetical protein